MLRILTKNMIGAASSAFDRAITQSLVREILAGAPNSALVD